MTKKESLAATDIEPDNTEKARLPLVTNIIKNTEPTNQTFWINTVRLDGNSNINGNPKLIDSSEKFPKSFPV